MKILPAKQFSINSWKDQGSDSIIKKVALILKKVKEKKDQALQELTLAQTSISVPKLQVPTKIIEEACNKITLVQKKAFQVASKNIKKYHLQTKPKNWQQSNKYKTWGQRFQPIEKIGIYIPGGLAAYPSTVLMNIIPAQIAGVNNISVVSPPTTNGLVHTNILAALHFLGIEKVFSVGGAQAIAALAYGTQTIEKVHLITGPGNQFVAEAKKQLFGTVAIDSIAGPSEVVIFLDKNINIPCEWIAHDLLAQAEHGENSKTLLITSEKQKAQKIADCTQKLLQQSQHKAILQESIKNFGFILIAENVSESIATINKIAPEHLQIFSNNKKILSSLKNVGAIFWGTYSPVAMGDYIAGPNHTLPTASTAKFFSALSVQNFMKSSSYLEYSKQGFQKEAPFAITLAKMEEQIEHSNSIKCRLNKLRKGFLLENMN